MNRSKWTISEKVLFSAPLLIGLVGAAMVYSPDGLFPLKSKLQAIGLIRRPESNARTRNCQTNLKMIGLALKQYIQDYDEKYPLIATGGATFGWADSIEPYVKSATMFHCPSNPAPYTTKPTAPGYTTYFYNSRFSSLRESLLDFQAQTIVVGEGFSSNARYNQLELPIQWLQSSNSPLRRHVPYDGEATRGANYAFADGHVKWLQPSQFGATKASSGGYTFSIQ